VAEEKKYRVSRRKMSGVIVGFLLVLLVLLLIFRKKGSDVKDIVVDITHLSDGESDFIKEKDIKEIVKRAFEADLSMAKVGQVDVKRVEAILEKDPFIENAESFIDASSNLNIKITQREPILRVIDNNGLNYYLDKLGTRMPLSKYFSVRVPIVTGAVPPHVNDFLERKKYGLKDVFLLVQRLNADPFFAPMIQQIIVDASGEFTLIPILGDQKIRIGTLDNLDEKLERLKTFYKEAMPYEGWKTYRTISVKYKNQIVCKKK
jgi:cell division protein FtsQ